MSKVTDGGAERALKLPPPPPPPPPFVVRKKRAPELCLSYARIVVS